MATTVLRYWAAAREAAGAAQEEVTATTLAEALSAAIVSRGAQGKALAGVFAHCSYLVDGNPVGRRDPDSVRLAPGAVVEVLPPFAGG
ncbi:MAG TPA: MoaD/ThiS family protein [Actinocrinis sp.]|jgi:molybdopterin converting factor small subunit